MRIAEINESVKCSLDFIEEYRDTDPDACEQERLYMDQLRRERLTLDLEEQAS